MKMQKNSIFKYLKPYTIPILISMILIFVQTLLNLDLPNLMSDIVDKGVINQDMNKVYSYGLKMLLVTLIACVANIFASYIASKVSAGFAKNLRNAMFEKVESYSLNEFNKIQTSSLITRTTNDVTQIQNLTLMMIRMMIQAPLMCIGCIILAVSKNLKLSIMFTVVIPIILILTVLLARYIVPLFTKIQKYTDRLNQIVREKLTGVRVIRAFSKEKYEAKRYDKANKNIYDITLKAGYTMSLLMPLLLFFVDISAAAVIWFGSHLVNSNEMEIGDMMAFMQYSVQVLFSIMMVAVLFILIPRAIVSAKRINEVLRLDSSVKDNGKTLKIEDFPKPGEIEFKDVSFAYNQSDEPVLKNINFRIRKGQNFAIIGGTGSGKTTILNLILRFYDATSGSIYISGKNIKDMSLDSLREMIGFVPQKINLFSGTIAQNLRFGKQDATDQEIIEALKIAQAYDFVSKLDDGINAKVSQGGTNFSGGQKQRLSIARAIIKKPQIYIFDDSFSALDFATDSKLRKALSTKLKGVTTITVAQRVSTILNSDLIIFIDEGKIIAEGTHHELLNSCESYRQIVMSQITLKEAEESGR